MKELFAVVVVAIIAMLSAAKKNISEKFYWIVFNIMEWMSLMTLQCYIS